MLRKVDEFGRVVLPNEMRYKLNIYPENEVEITMPDRDIIISKPARNCVLCGTTEDLVYINGKAACRSCGARICNAKNAD